MLRETSQGEGYAQGDGMPWLTGSNGEERRQEQEALARAYTAHIARQPTQDRIFSKTASTAISHWGFSPLKKRFWKSQQYQKGVVGEGRA